MKDIYKSYYTKSPNIATYMASMIQPNKNDLILEPCGGDGMLIDALLSLDSTFNIDTCEIDEQALKIMQEKYNILSNVVVRKADILIDSLFDEYTKTGHYDKIIGNPPYGGWQDYQRRIDLKQKYNGFYVHETYSLFLLRCISLLKEGGILSFIIPDTFLFLHNHKKIRKYLLEETLIKEIVIFPSKFFPGVSFGYSKLCIITLQKVKHHDLDKCFNVIQGLKSNKDLLDLAKGHKAAYLDINKLSYSKILKTQEYTFLLNKSNIVESITNSKKSLGDFADCVTGIYCGDNRRFLAITEKNSKKNLNYNKIKDFEIDYLHNSIRPLENNKKYIPIVKGSSSTKYFRTNDEWLIKWTISELDHYNNDKKARFQNSKYYFRTGIAVPMVKSSIIKATLMQNRVFDQSIVGIFSHDKKYLLYILAYLNSTTANNFIHTINPTANNSANYLKRLPFYIPTDLELSFINELVNMILQKKNIDESQNKIDLFFQKRLIS